MCEKGEIKLDVNDYPSERQHLKHLIFSQSGIVFGYPSTYIFAREISDQKWTLNEKLCFLLFECHLYIYRSYHRDQDFDQADFINKLLEFYEHHSVKSFSKLFTFFIKEAPDEKLEKLLEKRTEIKKNLLDPSKWVSYLSNAFIYLDVILFDEFLGTQKTINESNYEWYAENALYALILSAQADGIIQEQEKIIFEVFLASAQIDGKKKDEFEDKFYGKIAITDISKEILANELVKRFLLDISILCIYENQEADPDEIEYLRDFCEYIEVNDNDLNETLVMVENFVIKHNEEISFLSSSNAVEKMYGNVSKRWIKILGRNKDKLTVELKQSKELLSLIKKSTREELSKEEKEKVKTQFMDIVKSMPALAIFMLPGGALLLPLVLKIIPDLLPTAFRDNEIEK